jgi:hypothetical protein
MDEILVSLINCKTGYIGIVIDKEAINSSTETRRSYGHALYVSLIRASLVIDNSASSGTALARRSFAGTDSDHVQQLQSARHAGGRTAETVR